MEFSQILKQLRVERGMSQQEVADRLGLNKQAVSQYERGVRKPNFEIAEQLADIFNVDLNYLLDSRSLSVKTPLSVSVKISKLQKQKSNKQSKSLTYFSS